MKRLDIYTQINLERSRQIHKFGDQSKNDPFVWGAILGEKVGEVQKAMLKGNSDNLKTEIIQTIAVGVAWLECLDHSVKVLTEKELKRLRAGPSEAQLEEEGPLLMMLDNYEKYLVQIRGGASSKKLDAAFAQFRDLLEKWINNDTLEQADEIKDGLSEEDIYQIKEIEKLHLGGHVNSNELTPNDCIGCWQIFKLKKAWGIE